MKPLLLKLCVALLFCSTLSNAQSNTATTITMTLDQFHKITKLSTILPNYNAEKDGKVESFAIYFQRRNTDPIEFLVEGDHVDDTTPKVRSIIQKGDVITFTKVMLRKPNTEAAEERTGIVIKIR